MAMSNRVLTMTLAALAVSALMTLAPASAQAQGKAELHCQKGLGRSTVRYYKGASRARQACVARIAAGSLSPVTDCISGEGDDVTALQVRRAKARLASRISRQCFGVDLISLNFPGTCPFDGDNPWTNIDLGNCIDAQLDAVIESTMAVQFPQIGAALEGADLQCVQKAGRKGSAMAANALKARTRCQSRLDRGVIPGGVQCMEGIPPFGNGTGDRATDKNIEEAYIRLLAGVPEVCASADVDALGFSVACDDPTGGRFNIFDLKSCQFNTHRDAVEDLLEASYPKAPVCGNGIHEYGEDCDDGNLVNTDACLDTCVEASCGDGEVEAGVEECDDSNSIDTDSCRNSCVLARCGDSVVQSGVEQCDDGNASNNDDCLDTCLSARCGDGFFWAGVEDCDDGGESIVCDSDCTVALCGDGTINSSRGESCDNGAANSDTFPDACRSNCQPAGCGDTVIDSGELCDDGNVVNGDGCSDSCVFEAICGDGVTEFEEECDDSNVANGDGCSDACLIEFCGDGSVNNSGSEQCDDGNTSSGDGCSASCVVEFCGDGSVNNSGNEECDDGNLSVGDGCDENCIVEVCGNGVLQAGEACDDGGETAACDADCTVAECGDGTLNTSRGEQCDDGAANSDVQVDACRTDCVLAGCGDLVIDSGEQCDNGAANSDTLADACRLSCQLPGCGDQVTDSGEVCDDGGESIACDDDCTVAECGDSTINATAGEDCDDGNTNPRDNCNGECRQATCGDGVACTEPGCTTGPGGGPEECDLDTACCQGCAIVATGCQHPLCPDAGELQVWAGVGRNCTVDEDCPVGFCDGGLGRCRTPTMLDSGTTGIAHDSDVNDNTTARGNVLCEGPIDMLLADTGGCGVCELAGVDPVLGSCRCANDRRQICDSPFQPDADCGVDTNGDPNICQCFLAPPFPLSSGGVAVCVLSRFTDDLVGTANVDTGEVKTDASLRVEVYLGLDQFNPCPTCDGDTVYADGVRDGVCSFGNNLGQSCDATATNHTFPFVRRSCSIAGSPCEKNTDCPAGESCDSNVADVSGGEYSLDCLPATGKNVSGQGLPIAFTLTAGTQVLEAGLSCPFPFTLSQCHCLVCSGDTSVPCSSNEECSAIGAGACSVTGTGVMNGPNPCISFGKVCTATENNEAECPGVVENYCDGFVRATGEGYISCASDGDCGFGGLSAGNCTLSKTRECFLDSVRADGLAIPGAPVVASVFCIAPVSSAGVNAAAGLPGPGRVLQQVSSTLFCANDHSRVYTPGDPSSCE